MRKALSVGKSVAGAVLLTAATVAMALLYLMFSTTESEPVYREALFGSVFFKTQETTGGGLGVTMGVEEPLALLVLLLLYRSC